MASAYLDASAAVKLIRTEAGSEALRDALGEMATRVSSELLEIELRCVAYRLADPDLLKRVDLVLAGVDLLPLSPAVRRRAAGPFNPPQRALDAIHLATALDIDLDGLAFVSYDHRQLEAARSEGLEIATPE